MSKPSNVRPSEYIIGVLDARLKQIQTIYSLSRMTIITIRELVWAMDSANLDFMAKQRKALAILEGTDYRSSKIKLAIKALKGEE